MTRHTGFSLIELAIVLVITTLLIGGLAVPLAAQIQARRIAETQRVLDDARDALIGYAMSHTVTPPATCICDYGGGTLLNTTCPSSLKCPATGTSDFTQAMTRQYLPCPDAPDDGNPATPNDGDGLEETRVSGGCPRPDGNLPWATLGVASQDAWGNRIHYRVTADFANSSLGISGTGAGELQVCTSSANASASGDCSAGNVAQNAALVILSHGPNGWGGQSVNKTTLRAPTALHERENANTDHNDGEFVSRPPSASDSNEGEFDDLVRWLSADQIRGRICPAGGCP